MIKAPLRLPQILPNKKMLAIDIGGTLAKAAFYIPKPHLESLSADGKLEALTESSIPRKSRLDL